MTLAESLPVLFGLAGLVNPFTLLIGAVLGWYADARVKLIVAGFAAAALSVLLDAALNLSGISPVGGYEGGPLAVFPFRFVGGGLAAALTYGLRGKSRRR